MFEFVSSAPIRMKLCLVLVWSVLLSTEAKIIHRDTYTLLCSDTDQKSTYRLDREELLHSDLSKGTGTLTIPQFADLLTDEEAKDNRVTLMDNCKKHLAECVTAYKNPAEPKDAPQSSIYSKDDVKLGTNNTLICYITGFYPPKIGVLWSRNDVKVTGGVSFSRFYPTSDGTYNMVSRLSFIPEKGDIYTCTVKHAALDRPLTKTWDVQVALPRVGPTAFCVAGLAAGLLGVVVGTFFLVREKNATENLTVNFTQNLLCFSKV
ncbi:H-2 class II histocompatibility antigen, A-U alpha chain-like [Colossoma macropomum]|uniref:H-2 class II histocompatibility antigen, A-U alpha chain-like n=1 Tax=Colossoma macropomum TaxID=42526 RepID=UPI001863FB94|nr:H-2 class II histocompatibility antigen, A-U alpha chain-like [Colossoma macropomum]